MLTTFVESCEVGFVVYVPGTTCIAETFPTLEDTLTFARAEWPVNDIRIIRSVDAREIGSTLPSRCTPQTAPTTPAEVTTHAS